MAKAKKALNAFLREQGKRKQEGSCRRAATSILGIDRRIPTGAIDLDYALGGGLKVGNVTLFWGKKSGGKTSSALRTCGEAQNVCRNCFRRARRDGWVTVVGLKAEKPGDCFKQVHEWDANSALTRGAVHEKLIKDGYSIHPIMEDVDEVLTVIYVKGDTYAMAIHTGGDVESIRPSEAELEEDPEARWEARGFCDCFARKLYDPEEPSIDELMEMGLIEGSSKPAKKSKKHRAALEAWNEGMSLNSYNEMVVAWFDEEMTLDIDWATKLGVDTDRLLLIWSNSAEEAIDIMAGLIFTGEVDLLAIDSIAQLTPKKELTESAEAWQQGLAARLMNKAIRRWNKESANVVRYGKRPVTQIWINQEREKIGVMFGSPATMPGGKGQGFQVVSEIKFRHGATETVEELWGAKDKNESITIPVWEEFIFKVTKSKGGHGVGLRDVEGSYRQAMRDTDAYCAGTVIDWERVFKMSLKYLVEQEKKGSASKYKLGGREYTSQAAILTDLRDDVHFYDAVRQSILEDAMLRSM